MNIEKSTLDLVLEPYNPSCRYLLEANLEFPRVRGKFSIPKSFYIENTGHFNAVELVLCFNQLAYSLFAEAGRQGLIKELGRVELKDFKKYQLENSFIIGMDNIKFREQINPLSFLGTIELKKVITKEQDHLYFFKTDYDFAEGKATGSVNLALLI